jgi:hypothetical protein
VRSAPSASILENVAPQPRDGSEGAETIGISFLIRAAYHRYRIDTSAALPTKRSWVCKVIPSL